MSSVNTRRVLRAIMASLSIGSVVCLGASATGCGYTTCPSSKDECDTVCTDLASDRLNCGTCGNECAEGFVCDGSGACAPSCQPGLANCDGTCADTDFDRRHCGDCGVVCEEGFVCNGAGSCELTCQAGLTECEGACVDTDLDRFHCGLCGRACDEGLVCNGTGSCEPTCQAGLTDCEGVCVDTNTDRRHCGECGEVCDEGFVCDGAGACQLTCQPGLGECDGACVDTAIDRHHCGKCGEACAEGFVCDGTGSCELSCQFGLTDCSGTCVDTHLHRRHCGECGKACDQGFVCDGAGSCELSCQFGLTDCSGTCVDTGLHRRHCGECGKVCDEGFVCDGAGSCELSCQAGLTICEGACVDTSVDRRNCGECGAICDDGFVCGGTGTCELSCQAGLMECGGTCVDTDVDRRHCGGCGTVCEDGFVCDGAGSCELSCQIGLTDCNGSCANTSVDRRHCGGCGEGCDEGFVCDGTGSCELSCQAGLTICNGTCTDTSLDRRYCGDCETVCGEGSVCDGAGSCELSCQAGLTDCSGICVDTRVDRRHCGDCGEVCDEGFVCDGQGSCELSCQDGLMNCDDTCVDVAVHPAHCGGCNLTCVDGEVCSQGACVPASECGSPAVVCGGTCVDSRFDPANCGACGVRCDEDQICSQGSCGDRCLGSTLCEDRCADLSVDPRNCGDCGNQCNAGETCVEGECTEGPTSGPRCQSTLTLELNDKAPFFAQTDMPTCELLPNGAGRMTYVLGTGDGPYAACVFANGLNLNAFDADSEASGVLEVEFCAAQTTSGEVNLWYGAFPTRKKIELLGPADTMEPGCRTVRKAPEQAVCHWTARTQWAGDCGVYTGPGYDSSCSACGSDCNQGCPIAFPSTRLTFIAEQSTLAQVQPAVLELRALRFLPEDCTCTNDAQCAEAPGRTVCESGLFSSAVCPAGASVCGVCVSDGGCDASLTPCGGDCVDTGSDEAHCGGCDSPCVLTNAEATCAAGECRLLDCKPGFGDADGDEANGCECEVSNAGEEVCDGVDNDCDGLTDWQLEPDPHSVCECFDRELAIDRDEQDGQGGCEPPTCNTLQGGGLEMTYCFNECDNSAPYARCLFAGPVDLSDFDANFGRDGVLEVVFEVVDNPIAGKLHLNYGVHPRRKYVELVARGESLQPGVYRQYYTPDQVRFSSAAPYCQETCGPCAEARDDAAFGFDAADMTLVAEGCASAVDARIRLLSVNIAARGCGCVSDTNCSDTPERPVCYPPDSGAGACGWPGSLPPGMCGADSGCETEVAIGTPCEITVDTLTCEGTWQCRDGNPVCEVVSCGA